MYFFSVIFCYCYCFCNFFFLIQISDTTTNHEHRRLPLEGVKDVFKVRVHDIIGFIQEKYGIKILAQDLHNINRDRKNDLCMGLSDEPLLQKLIQDVLCEETEACCGIIIDTEGVAEAEFLQTSDMGNVIK